MTTKNPSQMPARPGEAAPALAQPAAGIAAKLRQATSHHQRGEIARAQLLYREILAQAPDHFDALHMLGVCEYQNGRHASAVELIARAIRIDPDYPLAHVNMGNALRGLGRQVEALASYDQALRLKPEYATAFYNKGIVLHELKQPLEALASYERALRLQPNHVEALVNQGIALRDLKRAADALASYERALRLKPDHADALVNRGNALRDMNRAEDGLASYDRALRIKPDHADALYNRGNVLVELNRPEEAIAAYRQALANGGDAEQIKFALAALGADAVPDAAPAQFVASLFDQYANRFDHHLVSDLKYQSPTELAGQITRFCPARELDVLDLGCGTGLAGALLRPLARTLTGVDLSPNMLEKARQRKVYDDLIEAELTTFLQTKHGAFDLAVAADVFVYIGDLARVFAGVRNALRHGGWFSFSIESNEGGDFILRATRRYAHSTAYVEKLAANHGFSIASIEPGVLRQEKGADVKGYYVLMRCE